MNNIWKTCWLPISANSGLGRVFEKLKDTDHVGASENSTRSCKLCVAGRVASDFKVRESWGKLQMWFQLTSVTDIVLKNYFDFDFIPLGIRLTEPFIFPWLAYCPPNTYVHSIASHYLEMAFDAFGTTALWRARKGEPQREAQDMFVYLTWKR